MKKTLDKLEIGKKGIILSLDTNKEIKRRFLDLGLIEGVEVLAYLKSPFNDPIAYKVKNAIIAIRNCDSRCIVVDEI